MRMEWVRNKAASREFERFAAEASGPLLRTGFLMTGNAKDAEDLVQETLLRVARRWSRVRSMDHPAAYARRILINLVLHDADHRVRQRTELQPHEGAAELADKNAAAHCGRSMTRPSSAGRWPGSLPASGPCWCCATGLTYPSPRSPTSSTAPKAQ
jgi:DNA-directed RNA polymerase specialized sigma24 family protein